MLGTTVLVLVLLLLSFPWLLSSKQGLQYVIRKLNANSSYHIQADKWRLRWFSKSSLSGLWIRDEKGRPLVQVETITVKNGLMRVLYAPFKACEVEIEKPTFFVSAQGHQPAPSSSSRSDARWSGSKKTPSDRAPAPRRWPLFPVHVRVLNGTLIRTASQGPPTPLLHDLRGQLGTHEGAKRLRYELTCASFDRRGSLQAKGFIELTQPMEPKRVTMEHNLSLDAWGLAPYLSLVNGTAEGQVEIKGDLTRGTSSYRLGSA